MKRSTSILLISSEFPPGPGGIGRHGYCLGKALAGLGAKVHVATNADFVRPEEVTEFDRMLPANLIVHRTFRSGWKTYFNRVRSVWRVMKEQRFDAVLVSGKFSLWCGGLIKLRRPDLPVLAILHGSEVNLGNPVLRWLTHRCIGRADILVPVSRFTRSLVPEGIQARKTVQVIPNGLDPGEWKADAGSPMELKGEPVLLTVGNVTRRKGQHRVIHALPAILETFPEACYHVVGLPTMAAEFQALAERLGVGDRVVFHGRLPSQKDLVGAYKAADVFLILSENQPDGDVEGFGIVILEANALGLPSVGAQGCGIEDAIEDGLNGFLVDSSDPEAVRDAVAKVVANREGLADKCRGWAARHDWEPLAGEYLKLIEQQA